MMMGRLNRDQEQLFYSFRLDDVVPDDHLVRAIAAVLDLSWVHAELVHQYASFKGWRRDGALSQKKRRTERQGALSRRAHTSALVKDASILHVAAPASNQRPALRVVRAGTSAPALSSKACQPNGRRRWR
jgi:hypothetical protein